MFCGPHRLQDKRKSSRGKDSLYLEDGGNWRPLINVLKPRTLISGSVFGVFVFFVFGVVAKERTRAFLLKRKEKCSNQVHVHSRWK